VSKKFDVIIGNPPYQNGNESSFYTKFLDLSIEKLIDKSEPYVIALITPGQWLSKTAGKTGNFKHQILNNGLKYIKFFSKQSAIDEFQWGAAVIGGITYFILTNVNNCSGSIEIENFTINQKFSISIEQLHSLQFIPVIPFEQHLDSILKKIESKSTMDSIHNRGKVNSTCKTFNSGNNLCVMSKGKFKLINAEHIKHVNEYKVIYNYANDHNMYSTAIKKILIPGEIATESFLYFIGKSEQHCKNIDSYVNTVFFKFLKSLMSFDHNATSKTFSKIPIVNFSESWDDNKIQKTFQLSDEEMSFMNNYIQNLPSLY
jgi:site-specific DNA-methyltransferase (adenine-specific)